MLAGYNQSLEGLSFLVADTSGIDCNEPIDTTFSSEIDQQRIARLAAVTTVCQAKNAVYQGTTKIQSWGWKEIYEVLKLCASSGFATAPDGIIPKCLWDVPIAPPLAYYQADPAFVAGFIDGAYSTVGQLFSSAVSILDIATCYSPNVGTFNPSPKCIEIMTKTFETFDMIRELVTNKTVRDQAWVQIKKQAGQYIDQTVCLQNSCRYEQGKIAFEVASMFVGISELKAGLQAAKFTKILKAVDNISDQIKVIHHAIHGLGGKFVKTASSGVVDVVMKSGQKVFKCTNGVLSEIRWKTGSGWIQSKVLYGVDYINSTGNKVKNGVLKLYKRTNCRLSADAADDACDWAVEGVVAGIKEFFEKGATKKGKSNRNIKIDKPRSATDLLETNAKYNVDGYLFETDEGGRVKKVSGDLELNNGFRERELTYQEQIQFQDRHSGDDGGHLIGNWFRGPNEAINIVPMRSSLNRYVGNPLDPNAPKGAWLDMEREWANALSSVPKKTVNVEITISYGSNNRPRGFSVKYRIDGILKTRQFIN